MPLIWQLTFHVSHQRHAKMRRIFFLSNPQLRKSLRKVPESNPHLWISFPLGRHSFPQLLIWLRFVWSSAQRPLFMLQGFWQSHQNSSKTSPVFFLSRRRLFTPLPVFCPICCKVLIAVSVSFSCFRAAKMAL